MFHCWHVNQHLRAHKLGNSITHSDMQSSIKHQCNVAKTHGLSINTQKTKLLLVNTRKTNTTNIVDTTVADVDKYYYLGSETTEDSGTKSFIIITNRGELVTSCGSLQTRYAGEHWIEIRKGVVE